MIGRIKISSRFKIYCKIALMNLSNHLAMQMKLDSRE